MKRRMLSVLLILCSLLPVLSGCRGSAAEGEEAEIAYYTDIPGVTEEDIEALEALKYRRSSFTYAVNYSTEAFLNENGEVSGFSKLLCERMGELLGIEFRVHICDWDVLIHGLDAHEIDFTGELTATTKREESYHMTSAIAERSLKYFSLEGSEKLSEIAKTRSLKYAFLAGSTTAEYVGDVAEEQYVVTFVDNYEKAVQMLRVGAIDAFFEDGSAEAAFDVYGDVVATEYFPMIYTPVSLSTAQDELLPVIQVIQKYLEAGGIYEFTRLYNDGQLEYYKYIFMESLTPEEREYIDANPQVPIAIEYDNYPVCFYNTQEEQWQGIAVDVLAEITTLTGLAFIPANEPGVEWAELLQMLEDGEVDLITELIYSTDRRGKFLWPDESYCTDNYALISRADQENIQFNQILQSRVALPEGSAYQEIFERWFPGHQMTYIYPSTDVCFEALEAGEVDFVMASRNLMLKMTNYQENPGYKMNISFDSTFESSFGLNINAKELRSIFNKAQKMVDTQSITENWIHKVFDYRSKLAREQVPYLIGLAVLLLVVLGLVMALFFRKRQQGAQLEELVYQRTAELEIQTQAAQVASRAKSEFLSRMSHEIRTPLNAIVGMAQIERNIPGLPEKAKDTNIEITRASQHLLEIINDVLDMAKIESGKFSLVEEPFNVREAMSEIAGMIKQRCDDRSIAFVTNTEAIDPIGVQGDRVRLKQVLINLLGNAVKFTPPGGNILFILEVVPWGSNVKLSFTVTDSGIGMSPEQMERLFVAFEQTDSSIAVKYGGTGLGLAISQSMVGQMGGEIKVKSEEGKGSTFSFEIELPRAELMEELELDDEFVPDFSSRRMLLAEDIQINRIIICELMEKTGISIDEAENGEIALKKFTDSPEGYYDLILMDIQMPKLDGYATTEAIRALKRRDAGEVIIIAMTANAYQEDIDHAKSCGMNDHLSKPIDIKQVFKTLSKYLN